MFLNWIEDCTSAREVGLNDSFTPVAHVHVGDVNPLICSCMQTGWFYFTQTHTLCQPHSAGSFSTQGFISEMRRGDAEERDGVTAHTSRGEMKIN